MEIGSRQSFRAVLLNGLKPPESNAALKIAGGWSERGRDGARIRLVIPITVTIEGVAPISASRSPYRIDVNYNPASECLSHQSFDEES